MNNYAGARSPRAFFKNTQMKNTKKTDRTLL
ncbi:hypothetical protein SC936_01490 [Aggregatibacter actinomycetemcomitans serotype e str. SC936]|nr:hypothetical protein SA3096_07345 [Aggregatibacter actinomycetemcomitans serotype e str. SA3096]KYK82515.1 hypothetical protein SC936_01490 [Aggregatibacter actinomycetemcomitans serotype e str. SC936]KYK95279.1 hypothetical protein ANH9776_04845 [Aggregatibacter actinomycetemcomitans serotype e str. ANH9776]